MEVVGLAMALALSQIEIGVTVMIEQEPKNQQISLASPVAVLNRPRALLELVVGHRQAVLIKLCNDDRGHQTEFS